VHPRERRLFVGFAVLAYVCCVLLPSVPTWGRRGRAVLGRGGGRVLLVVYVVICVLYGLLEYWSHLYGVEHAASTHHTAPWLRKHAFENLELDANMHPRPRLTD
jgi:hypothetical protein